MRVWLARLWSRQVALLAEPKTPHPLYQPLGKRGKIGSPSLSILLFTVTPGVSMGTQMRDLFRWDGPSLVVARRQIQSASAPFVIHILLPLITRSSEST